MAEGDFAQQLLEAARRDLTAWRKLAPDVEIHDSTLGFHAQQAVEKSIKAVLAHAKVAFRRSHDIAELLDVLGDAGLAAPPHAMELDRLNPFAIEARYGYPLAGPLDRDTVGGRIEAVVVWAGRVVGTVGLPG